MKAFLDTSVLVAAFIEGHVHHERSFRLLGKCERKSACCGAPTIAEVYSTLTRMPQPLRVSGHDSLLFLGSIRERLSVIALSETEYFEVIAASAAAGVQGGAIYDAVLGQCALKAGAKILYTWNLSDYLRLPSDIAGRVRTP
ncbi:MAG: PIN domain-containing protein [Acidobacteria bacterium]|nr:PIN domain-containing protein [Acidobacteriota bacterium]